MKKIVVVNAGPRKGWNTDMLLTEAARGAAEAVFPQELARAYEAGKSLGA